MAIEKFTKEYEFLSNFSPCEPLKTSHKMWALSVEHGYQAEKANTVIEHIEILSAETPQMAKWLGRRIRLRETWEAEKVGIMRKYLGQKFSQEYLREQLLATGDQELIEGNTWYDVFWGVDQRKRSPTYGLGLNMLGRLLMELRTKFRDADASK